MPNSGPAGPLVTPLANPTWRGPVGDGTATIEAGDDAWYAYPGTGGSSIYYDPDPSGTDYHLGEDWNREGGELASDQACAVGAGTVVFDGWMSGYGNTVIIDHGHTADGRTHTYSLYAHLATADNFGTELGVDPGDPVGTIGATGGTYSTHLHFELFEAETWAIGVNLGGGWLYDWEMETAESVTFDAQGNITSVVLTGEVDASRAGEEYARYYTSDYFIDTASTKVRWYDDPGGGHFIAGSSDDWEIFGLDGNDTLKGRSGDDLLSGGTGNDRLLGRAGEDAIYGDDGNDLLGGFCGRGDRLYGGDGADTLLGNGRGDVLAGNAPPLPSEEGVWADGDADVFRFSRNSAGTATILDFEDGLDRIDLSALANGMGDLTITSLGDDKKIVAGDLTIILDGAGGASLTTSDFIF